ncbi:hypothetical protein [Rhizobium leguminosarum]|uniref:hypothetical protein n=1 Tax=Rhizobium leguminosarum TaxID=384 RepID=UPI00039A5FA4|nr:hypothetical protein [Rhizobium leguminosarum]
MTRTNFPPDPESQAELDECAQNMIAEATSIENLNILSATGFARENISIMHQQIRATNLAWALGWTGRVKAGDTVAIVGGSFSGMMLAVILALVNDAIVLVFEKEDTLFARFRNKGHRHLSTNLNSRALGKNFDPSWSTPEYRSPIFAWPAGRASDVAAFWASEFLATYDQTLPIFISRKSEVRREMIKVLPGGLEIDFSVDAPHLTAVPVALLIDATGFGPEANPREVIDYSYWEAGHRLIYDHLVTPATVLISGCGDSGVIEALQYALNDFSHADVEALWPIGAGLEGRIDMGLVGARLDAVFRNDDIDRFETPVLSEIIWWLDQRSNIERNRAISWPWSGERWARPILEAIEAALAPHYAAFAPGGDIALADYDTLETFVEELALEAQFDARAAACALGDEWISRGIHALAEDIELPPYIGAIHAMARPGVEIILNGRTPTPYSRQLSPYNVWLMRLLLSCPSVRYVQGEIGSVAQNDERRFDIAFKDGTRLTVDRAVTRYGPAPGGAGLATGCRRDSQGGDWLLNRPIYLGYDPVDPKKSRYINAARDTVVAALDALGGRTKSGVDISKRMVMDAIHAGPELMPENASIYRDPLTWLAGELRAGRRPRYGLDALGDRAFTLR